jgi:GNAT superfamily N-acetyltransferase
MADIDQFATVRLGPDDARAGLMLSAEANWNQNEADWRFFLREGTVCGVRDSDGHLIATAALLPYTSGNAWISMVLVTANWRRRGLGTRLVAACLKAAANQDLVTWLDATPAGTAVYGPLGFVPTLQLQRLRCESSPLIGTSPALSPCSLAELIARDNSTIGFDRSALLAELVGRPGSRLLSNGEAVALVRDGRKARHIGPVLASSRDQALAIVDSIARSEAGPWLIDAVSGQEQFLQGLTGSGWIIERPFQRMRLGPATTHAATLPFAVAGPEYG